MKECLDLNPGFIGILLGKGSLVLYQGSRLSSIRLVLSLPNKSLSYIQFLNSQTIFKSSIQNLRLASSTTRSQTKIYSKFSQDPILFHLYQLFYDSVPKQKRLREELLNLQFGTLDLLIYMYK